MRRSRGKVLCAKLNRVAVQDSDILTTLTTRCKELRHLEIVNGFSGSSILDAAPLAMNLESIVLSEAAEMSLDGANVLLQKCPNLQRAEFKNLISAGNRMAWPVKMENLRILRLESGSKKVSSVFLNLNALFEHAPNITELSIIGWLKDNLPLVAPDFGKLPHLTHLTLNPVPTAVFPRLPASLTSLSMSGCYSMDFFSHPMTQINLSSLRLENLTELRIHDGQYLPADVARTLLAHCRGDDKLRILGITRCLFINDTVIQQFLDEGVLVAEHLEELDLSDNASITDTTVEALAQHGVAALKKLNLSRTRVTGAGLKTLVTHPKANKLERLVLNGCTSMGIDAAEYIKTKGIAVEFRFPDNLKYGKRIRYG
ncbi:RNI-like protein [Xylona heveae TC161]|uniref:RNI-like protein n=1 Tax=Xylona heveae (strain CBS 132557 / TC161) TaxID=1328760 RepID=A0A165I312_XYLHT|nr:RNI-like protein [Xylona heveae TC161]KZF24302.1 RNI-like protein [Xylona heveae TC161]